MVSDLLPMISKPLLLSMKHILDVVPQEKVSGNPMELKLITYHSEREHKPLDTSPQVKPLVLQEQRVMLLSLRKSIKASNKINFLKELATLARDLNKMPLTLHLKMPLSVELEPVEVPFGSIPKTQRPSLLT